MVQLDNTTKGEEMLTPEQEALNTRVQELPVMKEVVNDLEELKEGQKNLQEFTSNGFAKGKDRMDGLETMFKDHISNTKENHKEAMNAITDLKTEIKDNKIKDLAQDAERKREEFKAYKEKVWSIVKMVLTGVVSLIVGAIAAHLYL